MKVFLLLVGVALATSLPRDEFQEHIKKINSMETTWKAGHNFDERITMEDVKRWCGALSNPNSRLEGREKLLLFF